MNGERDQYSNKVAIVTYHDGFNYGAFLQVYALTSVIEQMGFSVEILNYKSTAHSFHEYKCLFYTRRFSILVGNIQRILKFRRAQKQLHMSPSYRKSNQLTDITYSKIVFGSDEIWNYTNPIVGLDLVYFGAGLKAGSKISYAASCGNLSADADIPSSVQSSWLEFDCVSVRDSNSKSMLEKYVSKPVEIHLDPTFLIEFPEAVIENIYGNYILIYTTGFSEAMQNAVKKYAKQKGYKLVSLGYFNSFCDVNVLNADPFEFLEYLKKSKEVITSMFHGLVLSIKYNKQFAMVRDPYRANKVEFVIKEFGLESRVIDPVDGDFQTVICAPIDYRKINTAIGKHIKRANNYLERSLSV